MQKHIAIVPLIGGMAIGAEKALGRPPEAVFSYDAFALNDSFLRAWYDKRGLDIPYISLDDREDFSFIDQMNFGEVDLVTSVCPCSGLSAANTSSGAGCQQNEWMYKSTEWVLDKIKPKVLIGENAPRLYGSFGQLVAITLNTIARRYGYLLTIVKTSTHFHGIPQKRERTFFVLFRDLEHPPIFNQDRSFYDGTWVDYLDSFAADDTVGEGAENPFHDELWRILETETNRTRAEIREDLTGSRRSILAELCQYHPEVRDRYIDEWIDKEEEDRLKFRVARKLKFTREKLAVTGVCNVWDDTPKFTHTDYYPAVMYKNVVGTWHPRDIRPITPREQMRLMGLPEDMDVPRKYVNAIAQNVPTCTAAWIVREALAAAEGRRPSFTDELTGDKIFRQSNLNGSHVAGMDTGRHLALAIEREEVEITPEFALA